MTKLPEIPVGEAEVMVGSEAEDPRALEVDIGSVLDIPIVTEDPEVLGEREGIHERIQAKI